MLRLLSFNTVFFLAILFSFSCNECCSSSENKAARVFFVNPKDGATVRGEFTMHFGLEGKKLRPAGENLTEETSGHHHVLIDNSNKHITQGQVVPTHATNIHYGNAQRKASLKLPKGKHTLTLQFANGAHISYGNNMAQTITINVVE